MRGNSVVRCVVAGAAIAAVLAVGYVSAGYAAPAGSSGAAGLTDTEPPPETTPAPDPAPPAPKPKPAPKPTPKAAPKPAPVHHAPAPKPAPTPTPQQTYTPPATHHVTKKKAVHHIRKHKRHKRVQHVITTPKVTTHVKSASIAKVNAIPTAAVATNATDAVRRSLIITGMGLAAILFLLVFAVPATGARFTPPGRVLMDHQTDLVLVGIAILVLTALLFAITS